MLSNETQKTKAAIYRLFPSVESQWFNNQRPIKLIDFKLIGLITLLRVESFELLF
jgi:hypothetical protein